MAELDIFAPQVSQVSYGLEGKSMCIWGGNRTGKTSVCCQLPKPVVLCMEDGLNAIQGVKYFRIMDWKSYVQFVKQITDSRNMERAKEMYQTIIIDPIDAMGDLCAQYICNKFGLETLGDKKENDFTFNAYQELKKENAKWLRMLLLSGFTVVYIGHEAEQSGQDKNGTKITKLVPSGDKRVVKAICDAVDIIGHTIINGLDENGNEIKSSLLLSNTPYCLAGSRFPYLTPYLPVFSAEALEKAVAEAVHKEEEAKGFHAVSFAEQTENKLAAETTVTPFLDLVEQIQTLSKQFISPTTGLDPRVKKVIEEYLGKGGKISTATEEQAQQLEMILFDMKALVPYSQAFEALRTRCSEIAQALSEVNAMDTYKEIVHKHLGEGRGVKDATPEQEEALKKAVAELEKAAKKLLKPAN